VACELSKLKLRDCLFVVLRSCMLVVCVVTEFQIDGCPEQNKVCNGSAWLFVWLGKPEQAARSRQPLHLHCLLTTQKAVTQLELVEFARRQYQLCDRRMNGLQHGHAIRIVAHVLSHGCQALRLDAATVREGGKHSPSSDGRGSNIDRGQVHGHSDTGTHW
jgi:hypothetical protein